MNPNAQNALLKLLEEGPPYAAFLLLTDNPGALLTTVRSRCEGLPLSPVTAAEAEAWLDTLEHLPRGKGRSHCLHRLPAGGGAERGASGP